MLYQAILKNRYMLLMAVYCQSSNMAIIELRLQGCLNKFVTCADESGFKFSPTKTLCVHFCTKNGLQPEPNLKLYGEQLPVEEQVKFLGLFFDKKLSFIPHIKYMKDKCRKALQLLRVISSKDWGGDRTTLLRIYRSHIRSKLDYGCIVYGSAKRSYLAVLDPIANQGLRLCPGAFQTSPIESLHVETGEPSLETRRLKLSLQYYMQMKANPENPAYSCVVNPEYKRLFNNKPGTIPPLGMRLQPHLEDMAVKLDAISVVRPPECPPWLLQQPNILFNLSDLRKGDTCPLVFQSMLLELFCRFPKHRKVYTEGSKEDKRTAMSFVCDHEFSCRMNDEASICTAELLAIEAAIEYIWDSSDEEFMIITDSLSSLQSKKLNNLIVSNILHMCHYLSGHKDIIFAGYPAILEYRAMNGLMFWPRLPWIRRNSFIIYHILISSTTSLSTLMTCCKVNGTSMSPANCSRYNQSLSDFLHQWNAEEMTLSYAGQNWPCLFHKRLFIERRIATYVLQYSSHCKTCPSQLCEICAHQKEVFCI